MGRLVIVSNRVPLPSERGPRAGGLAVALADALTPGSVWFGWSGRRSGSADGEVRLQRAEGTTYATIDLTEHEYRAFYLNFANGALWPLLLVAGGSFAVAQFVASNYIDYSLTDVLSALTSLIVTLLFLRIWSPSTDEEFAIRKPVATAGGATATCSPWQGWIPWVIVSAVVIVWTRLKIAAIGQQTIHWPGLHNAVFITLYNKAYAANWVFQPLGTGTLLDLLRWAR